MHRKRGNQGRWVYGQPWGPKAVVTKQCGRRLSSPNRTVIVKIMCSSTSLYTGCHVIITMGTGSYFNNLSNLNESNIYPCSKLFKSFLFLPAGQISNCVIINCAICLRVCIMWNVYVVMLLPCIHINCKRNNNKCDDSGLAFLVSQVIKLLISWKKLSAFPLLSNTNMLNRLPDAVMYNNAITFCWVLLEIMHLSMFIASKLFKFLCVYVCVWVFVGCL